MYSIPLYARRTTSMALQRWLVHRLASITAAR